MRKFTLKCKSGDVLSPVVLDNDKYRVYQKGHNTKCHSQLVDPRKAEQLLIDGWGIRAKSKNTTNSSIFTLKGKKHERTIEWAIQWN